MTYAIALDIVDVFEVIDIKEDLMQAVMRRKLGAFGNLCGIKLIGK